MPHRTRTPPDLSRNGASLAAAIYTFCPRCHRGYPLVQRHHCPVPWWSLLRVALLLVSLALTAWALVGFAAWTLIWLAKVVL